MQEIDPCYTAYEKQILRADKKIPPFFNGGINVKSATGLFQVNLALLVRCMWLQISIAAEEQYINFFRYERFTKIMRFVWTMARLTFDQILRNQTLVTQLQYFPKDGSLTCI